MTPMIERVGGGPANAVLLQRLDERGLAVAGRRLGEFLLGHERLQLEPVAFVSAGSTLAAIVVFGARRVGARTGRLPRRGSSL